MKLNLTLKDRVIILKNVLPLLDTRQNIRLKDSIVEKIKLSTEEESHLIVRPIGNGQYDIGFVSKEVEEAAVDVYFTKEEFAFLKQRVELIDSNAMFSSETKSAYEKILDAKTAKIFNAKTERIKDPPSPYNRVSQAWLYDKGAQTPQRRLMPCWCLRTCFLPETTKIVLIF
jgi:hypothetical protein